MDIEVQKMLSVGGLDGFVKAIIVFLKSDLLFESEVNVINPDPKDYSPDYIFPRDFILGSYSKDNIPDERVFAKVLEKAEYQFSAVAGLDETDMTRIQMIPSDLGTLGLRVTCHFTEEEMSLPKNERLKLEKIRKKQAFSIIGKVIDEIALKV